MDIIAVISTRRMFFSLIVKLSPSYLGFHYSQKSKGYITTLLRKVYLLHHPLYSINNEQL